MNRGVYLKADVHAGSKSKNMFVVSLYPLETSTAQRAKPLGQISRLQHYNLLPKDTMSTNYLLWNLNLSLGAFMKMTESVIRTIWNRATITANKKYLARIGGAVGGGVAVAAGENLHQALVSSDVSACF